MKDGYMQTLSLLTPSNLVTVLILKWLCREASRSGRSLKFIPIMHSFHQIHLLLRPHDLPHHSLDLPHLEVGIRRGRMRIDQAGSNLQPALAVTVMDCMTRNPKKSKSRGTIVEVVWFNWPGWKGTPRVDILKMLSHMNPV